MASLWDKLKAAASIGNANSFSNPTPPAPQVNLQQLASALQSNPSLLNRVGNVASRLYDQANMLDNGRTIKQREPVNNRSNIGQLTHNGLTNTVGDFIAKPFAINPAQNVIETGRGLAADVTGNTAALNASRAREWKNLQSSLPGAIASNVFNIGKANTYDLGRQTLADLTGNKVASQNASDAYTHDINRSAIGALTNMFQRQLAGYQVKRDLPNLTKEQQQAALDQSLANAGIDPKSNLATQIKSTVFGGVQLAAPTFGLAKAGVEGVPFVSATQPSYLSGATFFDMAKNGAQSAQAGAAKLQDVAKLKLSNTPLGQEGSLNIGVIKDALTPKYAGLKKGEITTDPGKLDVLNSARDMLKHEFATRAEDQHTPSVAQRQYVIDGLHQIYKDTGLNFITGSHADRVASITKYLEQNGEAIQKLQGSLGGDEGGFVKVPGGKDELPATQPGLDQLNEGQILEKNYVSNLQAAQGEGAQLPTKQQMSPDAKAALMAKVRAQVKALDKNESGSIQATEPPAKPKVPVAKSAEPPVSKNRFTEGGKQGRQNIGPETQSLISGQHEVRNTKALGEQADVAVDKLKLDDAINQAHEMGASKLGSISDKEVAFMGRVMERADAEGRPNDASAIHDTLSEHLVAKGQGTQAAALLYQRSPQGILYQALRDLKRAGVEETPEMKAKLQTLTDAIKAAKNPIEKMNAVAKFHQAVSKLLPQKFSDQATSIWKAGLLSGAKTQTGNALSNATFAGLHGISNPLAASIDKMISLGTKERTKTLTAKGYGSGFAEGTKKGIGTLRTGIDARNYDGGKYEQHAEINFKNPVVQKIFGVGPNMVFRGMNAADQPWYYGNLKNTLYDLAKADGLNKGLKGKELQAHMDKMVTNPTPKMAQIAADAGAKSTLNYDTLAAKAVQGLHGSIDRFQGKNSGVGKAIGHGAVNVLAPFIRVPTAYLARSLDYSPVGYVKALANTVSSLKAGEGIPQRALSEALAEATTGSAVIFIGGVLAGNGLVSGQYPKDQKEIARWKAEHITPNSIKIGNKWISLNYLGPSGLLVGAGKDFHDAAAAGDNATIAALSGAGKNLMGQSFLTGFSGFSNAIQDPQRSAKSFINSEVGSIVPSIVNDAANFGDSWQRETNNISQTLKSRLPFARNSLPVKQDVYGNDLKQRTNRLAQAIDPTRPSDAVQGNSVIDEVGRLHSVDPTNGDLQVTPTPIKKVLSVEGSSIRLNPTQVHDLQKAIGQATQKNWGQLIDTTQYQNASDLDKAAALNKLRQDTAALIQRTYVLQNNLAEYSKPPTKSVVKLGSGGFNPADYFGTTTTKKAATSKTAPTVKVAKFTKAKVAKLKTTKVKSYPRVKIGKLPSIKKVSLKKRSFIKVASAHAKKVTV